MRNAGKGQLRAPAALRHACMAIAYSYRHPGKVHAPRFSRRALRELECEIVLSQISRFGHLDFHFDPRETPWRELNVAPQYIPRSI